MQARSLLPSGRYPAANVRQFFQRNSTSGAFSKRNELFRDIVVHVLSKAGLLARKLLEAALCRLGSAALQTRLALCKFGSNALNLGAAVNVAVAIRSDVDNAEIDAKPIGWIEFLSLRNVTDDRKNPFALIETEIAFALPERQQSTLMFAGNERNLDAAVERPDRNDIIAETKDAIVIGLGGEPAEDRRGSSTYLECVCHLSNRANCDLRRKPELGSHVMIGQVMEIELAKYVGLEALGSKPGASCIAALKRLFERLRLLLGRLELDRRNELHVFKYGKFSTICQEGCCFLPALKDGVSAACF